MAVRGQESAQAEESTATPRHRLPGLQTLRRAYIWAVVAVNFTPFVTRYSRPRNNGRSLVPGHDPVRVLVFGSGLSVGYGVRDERLAVCGQLALSLAKGLGRGIVVEHKTGPSVRIKRAVEILGLNGAHTYRAVVYMPALTEMSSGHTTTWIRDLTAVLAHLRQTGGEQMPIVFSSLPTASQPSRLERPGVEPLQATNRGLLAVSELDDNVDYVEMPPVKTFLDSANAFDADYYQVCAERISAALIPHLKRP